MGLYEAYKQLIYSISMSYIKNTSCIKLITINFNIPHLEWS